MKASFPSDKRCSHTASHNKVGKELFGNRHKEGDTVHLPFNGGTIRAAIFVTPIEMRTMFMTPARARRK